MRKKKSKESSSANHRAHKIIIAMSPTVKENVRELVELSNSTTLSEVVRKSLAIYDFIIREKNAGSVILVRDENGKEREIVIL